METIDCKGMLCPQPVINTKKYFDSIEKGKAQILVDNEVAKNNILKLANSNGYKSNVREENSIFIIEIEKLDSIKQDDDLEKFSIIIGKDKLGDGDEVLGKTLMKSYLYALSESDKLPTHILFLNSGVKLTTEGSEVIESLMVLKDKNVEIMSCGTCLDFYGIKDKLIIGEITNMYTIVEIMNNSKNTITL